MYRASDGNAGFTDILCEKGRRFSMQARLCWELTQGAHAVCKCIASHRPRDFACFQQNSTLVAVSLSGWQSINGCPAATPLFNSATLPLLTARPGATTDSIGEITTSTFFADIA